MEDKRHRWYNTSINNYLFNMATRKHTRSLPKINESTSMSGGGLARVVRNPSDPNPVISMEELGWQEV